MSPTTPLSRAKADTAPHKPSPLRNVVLSEELTQPSSKELKTPGTDVEKKTVPDEKQKPKKLDLNEYDLKVAEAVMKHLEEMDYHRLPKDDRAR